MLLDLFENTTFVIDSRKVVPGCVFVALKGEKTDGHLYVREALEKGAKLAVVEKQVDAPSDKLVFVPSTVDFLAQLASYRLSKHNPLVIGITGSNGKTTTKEILFKLLENYGPFRNEGNLNTEIGLPLSIINGYLGQKIVILEMAMNKVGDIAKLCQVARPRIAVLLNVGSAHRGVAGGDEAILRGKLEIVENMAVDGTAVVLDDERIVSRIKGKNCVTFGYLKGDYQLISFEYKNLKTITVYSAKGKILKVELSNIWNTGQLTNLAAVFAVLDLLGLEVDLKKLEEFDFVPGRFKLVECKGIYIFDDCYNASLESFKVAVDTIKKVGKRAFAVVGSIKEQGEFSNQTHLELGKILEQLDGVIVYTKEPEIEVMKCSKEILRTSIVDEIVQKLSDILKAEDAVLFKASRAVEMEKVLQRFLEVLKC
ncbi:UDP-N-acetylmuramoyl-tripeptide--D-alanyl-D-alanine ligase [Pseudothermotoga thermarum]|uniref:UDP-N-acetylmuramoyl-tripeptide--D-alanyl-D-alanine ligase n=1 Tax=Pseudothermotoga thermarum DSM 5069 TaxID=688269 RepID=F7YW85_9THEM|nr:UDP-N-acetylmuramoyl-tripeptide--D-alanyl-D-alanine ligase [Pseudothermotoga thermarum]AEH51857.1 UDP-N-acetylmuramoylalanyl-D-glutamyl-2,6- diaminopimelate/D-alanyl-D-alanyl ligase [Pseudothermotoga thermarum DSM 5069]